MPRVSIKRVQWHRRRLAEEVQIQTGFNICTRYYNVIIKRFINADNEKEDISNGQSLNRYCYVQNNPISFTDPFGLSPAFNLESFAHGVLDFLGCFPVIGTIADIAQAVKCGKLAEVTKYISTGARMLENAAVFTVSAGQAAETARGMWKKYAKDKQPVCTRCQTKYPVNQFVKGTIFDE